ncbi:MAG: alanine--tRNA ligase [Verrucomicrobiota bacterium]|nr:alanine--tRNA ligase [Verrucomicrobiota bacterium]
MKAEEIRQSFLDFFKSKNHQIVNAASLLPESPNLLFTNAGMNQFVPYFLGDQKAPYSRACDTQKCIRAGGKHNDLEDVGFDTYHHTFFEMLGNWSFGDYFKKEAIQWAWELLIEIWKFPPDRLYASVYKPEDGEPADFDREAHELWSDIFRSAGLDPKIHVVTGGKKDNFWMMGETGPCGPCSELHLDLTPDGDSKGKLVNADSHLCIEIWNLVFIQFNADKEGNFTPLSSQHVDTGMGFERVAAVIQSTNGFTDFSKITSNYDTDVFSSIFSEIEELSDKSYQSTLPVPGETISEQEQIDIAFRVIGDHLRALCFSIADGILPGNGDRNYVLRRILRRGVRYGRTLGFEKPFFHLLAPTLIEQMGSFFPELKNRKELIVKTLQSEEESFNKTLDRGLELFNREVENLTSGGVLSGSFAFRLYDTYGFPIDLTELMARESDLTVNKQEFDLQMEEQRARARKARKSVDVLVSEDVENSNATVFVGYESNNLSNFKTTCIDSLTLDEITYLIFEESPFYAEMGGQLADMGSVFIEDKTFAVTNVIKDASGRFLHALKSPAKSFRGAGEMATLNVDSSRRKAIQRHHTATHVLHWALREVLGDHIRQAGSLVEPNRLRFDFSHFEGIKPGQLQKIECLANEMLLSNDSVETYEIPFADKPDEVIAFFGDKYGDLVRVVNLGGWSQELCGGTHVSSAGEVGSLRITGESAISAGTRRIEAVAGLSAYQWTDKRISLVQQLSSQFACKPDELPERIAQLQAKSKELDKRIRSIEQKEQAGLANQLIENASQDGQIRLIKAVIPSMPPNDLRSLAVQINKRANPSVVLLASESSGKCGMVCICSDEAIKEGHQAGKYLGELASKLGGKGGGKPDFAMGGAPANHDLKESLKNISLSILDS